MKVGRTAGADLRLAEATTTLAGSRGVFEAAGRRVEFESPLVGAAHLENLALAAAAGWALGIPWNDVLAGLRATPAPACPAPRSCSEMRRQGASGSWQR